MRNLLKIKTLFIFFIFISSCHTEQSPTHFKGVQMSIPYCIQIAEPIKHDQMEQIATVIHETFSEIDRIYNNWNPLSEISHLNALEAYQPIQISYELSEFLQKVAALVRRTEGRFDPTVGALHRIWVEALQSGKLPSAEKLAIHSKTVGWQTIHLDGDIFWKENALTTIDLCGVAKGYAVDLLIERLNSMGLKKIYVEWGGEIRTIGRHSQNRPWSIAIAGHSIIDLTDAAIATSGSYLQNWNIEGHFYTHILDPRTQKPLLEPAISSASVIASKCYEADAIATALMLFPSQEEAMNWATQQNLQAFIW